MPYLHQCFHNIAKNCNPIVGSHLPLIDLKIGAWNLSPCLQVWPVSMRLLGNTSWFDCFIHPNHFQNIMGCCSCRSNYWFSRGSWCFIHHYVGIATKHSIYPSFLAVINYSLFCLNFRAYNKTDPMHMVNKKTNSSCDANSAIMWLWLLPVYFYIYIFFWGQSISTRVLQSGLGILQNSGLKPNKNCTANYCL